MVVYSPNMLKTFDECQKKYEYRYVKKISLPVMSQRFEKGKKIHALANYYLRGDNIEKFLSTLSEEEFSLWQRLLKNEFFQKKYVNSEYNLSAKLGEFWVGGRLDAFMKSDKDFFLLDYKTGKIPKNPQEDFQTMIYLLCADRILEKGWGNNYSLTFVYIDLKNDKNHTIEFSKTLGKSYEEKLIASCTILRDTKTFEKNTKSCEFCEYKKLCFPPEF